MTVPIFPDYFKTMGGRILYGREFTDAEIRSDAKVAVVNGLFAREFGASVEALGHQVTLEGEPPRTIIGIVKRMDYMTEGANTTQIFVPAHSPGSFFSSFVVQMSGRAEDHLAVVRDTVRSVDTHVPVFGVKTMEQHLDDALSRPKFYRTTLLFFAGFALLLALIGIYGVVSYAVSQRAREMGVRLALGTTPIRLRGQLLSQGLLTVGAGAMAGIAGAIFTGRFLESLVEGAKSIDLATFSFSILFIALVAATSIWTATRRVAGLDIMEILRAE
jgi:ABC-type antimicrobial peptide transport system permease subunit